MLLEAVGVLVLHAVLAKVQGDQRMSLADLDDAMVAGTWAMGAVFGAYLALCGAVLLRLGVRDRAPARWTRILLVSCAITHGVLGAVAVAVVGWAAFAVLMLVLGLLVLALVAYGDERRPGRTARRRRRSRAGTCRTPERRPARAHTPWCAPPRSPAPAARCGSAAQGRRGAGGASSGVRCRGGGGGHVHRSVIATPNWPSRRRKSGRDRPMTLPGRRRYPR